MRVEKIRLTENIFLLRFKNKDDVAKTFLRFQEHYESSCFAGKVFTHKEFKRWYKEKFGKKGLCDYYKKES